MNHRAHSPRFSNNLFSPMRAALPLALIATLAVAWTSNARGEDIYYRVKLSDLTFTDGALPKESPTNGPSAMDFQRAAQMQAYATLDGPGEVYVGGGDMMAWRQPAEIYGNSFICVSAPEGREVTGHLFVPKPHLAGMASLAFKIAPGTNTVAVKREFFQAKESHYLALRERGIPGAAWFRHEQDEAIAASQNLKKNPGVRAAPRMNRRRPGTQDETYSLFSGGRALSENLQLDRTLPAVQTNESLVDITNLDGIKVAPMDWKPLLAGLKPETDPLAASIPADQHALFFPSFQAVLYVMDQADTNGTPLLRMIEPRAEDMNTRGRYQKQLCLGLSELSRRIGPQLVDAVAVTGSDPYLRVGSDVGVLFQSKKPDMLKSLLAAQQAMAASAAGAEAKAVHGEVEGVAYSGVVSPDRSVCVYMASVGEVVFVSNSLYQLGCMVAANKGSRPALISQDEYIFFRSRYLRGDTNESAFLVLSDATIRRWCGPRWRIADARRMQVSAVLEELQATHLDALVQGTVQPAPVLTDLQAPDAGQFSVDRNGVSSSVYGSLSFLTPIAELPLAQVTKAESDAYTRWRDTYQQNWSQSFDPIAARFSVRPDRLGLELTVTPFIANSEYRTFIDLNRGAHFGPLAGDPHADAIAHLIMAIDLKSEPMTEAGNFLGQMSPALKINPFGWLGSSVALYADEDPFWDELIKATNSEAFLQKRYWDLPVALRFSVGNPLGVTVFLGALRAYSEQTSPGMTTWESQKYHDQPYVKVTARELASDEDPTHVPSIFYATSSDSLIVTLNEPLLKRALDRERALKNGGVKSKDAALAESPWLGTNLCLKLDQKFFKVIGLVAGDSMRNSQQQMAWNNLPILNEWKHRYPGQDPVKLHEQFWQAKLVSPGGGGYVWNEKWQTMESTVYGHPGEPKTGPAVFGPLSRISTANLGLNFENDGLSVKAVFTREGQ